MHKVDMVDKVDRMNKHINNILTSIDNKVKTKKVKGIYDGFDNSVKVSIIMTTYNNGNTIIKSLESILNQSYNNIEIIIVNDASTDDTYNKLKRYIASDVNINKVKVVNNMVNIGAYASRNIGLKYATGTLITFHDADDISSYYRIEKQVAFTIKHNLLMSFAKILRFTDAIYYNIDTTTDFTNYARKCVYKTGFVTMMFHKKLLKKIGNFKEIRFAGDNEYIERFIANYFKLFFDKITVTGFLNKDFIFNGYIGICTDILEMCYVCNDASISNNLTVITNERTKNNIIKNYRYDLKSGYMN
jgi:glycosyltransferase involved in cell wall biosynthesis